MNCKFSRIVSCPVADAGFDIVAYDTVTLDGSNSEDIDGSILHYQWFLEHKEKSNYNKTAQGMTPSITGLSRGFYRVWLTVEDNEGFQDTDEMVLSATGLKGDFDFDEDVDAIDLSVFSQNFGSHSLTVTE